MQTNYNDVTKLFQKEGMDFESIDIDESCKLFTQEMENGLKSTDGSLKMIPTFLSVGNKVAPNKPVIVIDMGGTNFRIAVVTLGTAGEVKIEKYKKFQMPGVSEEISKKEFFDVIVNYIEPVIDESDLIGICFSYASEPTEDMDGRIVEIGKQLKIKGVVGEKIGENIKNTLTERGLSADKKVVVLNDSVATLLGGKAMSGNRKFDSYIGFILGTGTNSCYVEKGANIKKLSNCTTNSMIINIETGGYNLFRKGSIDEEYDRLTSDPGKFPYEKMISGRYQGGLLLSLIHKAMEEQLFTDTFVAKAQGISELTAEEIDEFLYYPYGEGKLAACCVAQEDDRITLFYLIDFLIERAARLVLINIASIIRLIGAGKNPCKPVCVTAEGSAFYNSKLFRSKLDYYIKRYLNDEMGLYCEFIKVDNATLIGTAIAALVN